MALRMILWSWSGQPPARPRVDQRERAAEVVLPVAIGPSTAAHEVVLAAPARRPVAIEHRLRRRHVVDHDLDLVGGQLIGQRHARRVVLRLGRDRQPVDRRAERPRAVGLHVDAEPGAAHRRRDRRVPLQGRLAAGHDHALGVADIERAQRVVDLGRGHAPCALGREVGVAAGAREVARGEPQEHHRAAGVSALALQRGPESSPWSEIAAFRHRRDAIAQR